MINGIVIQRKLGFASAITLFPFIITETLDEETLNHERIHLAQQIEMLIIPFYLWYGIEYLINRLVGYNADDAYRNISFELEAYKNSTDFQYLRKRKLFGFVKYL
jgi:hypothetical protein